MQTLHDKHSPQTCLTAVTKSLYYRKFFWTRRRWIRHFSMLKSNFIKAVSFKKINLSLWNIHESIRLFLKSKQYYCCQLNEVLYILMNQNLLLRNDFFLQLVFFWREGKSGISMFHSYYAVSDILCRVIIQRMQLNWNSQVYLFLLEGRSEQKLGANFQRRSLLMLIISTLFNYSGILKKKKKKKRGIIKSVSLV